MTDRSHPDQTRPDRRSRAHVLAEAALTDLTSVGFTPNVHACVVSTAASVARTCGKPSPNGAHPWSRADVDDLVQDFLVHKAVSRPDGRGDALTQMAIAAGVRGDRVDRFRSKLLTAMKRFVVDRYRETPFGRLTRQIDDRLRRRQDVVKVDGTHWALGVHAPEPLWNQNDADLVQAVNIVDAPISLTADRPGRQSSICTTATLDAVCDALFHRAACPVAISTVRRVVGQRILPDRMDHLHAHLSGRDDDRPRSSGDGCDSGDDSPPIADRDGPAGDEFDAVDRADAVDAADRIWDRLDDQDRRLIRSLRTPARQVEALGFVPAKRSAIDDRQKRVIATLAAALDEVVDRATAAERLLQLHEALLAGRAAGSAP